MTPASPPGSAAGPRVRLPVDAQAVLDRAARLTSREKADLARAGNVAYLHDNSLWTRATRVLSPSARERARATAEAAIPPETREWIVAEVSRALSVHVVGLRLRAAGTTEVEDAALARAAGEGLDDASRTTLLRPWLQVVESGRWVETLAARWTRRLWYAGVALAVTGVIGLWFVQAAGLPTVLPGVVFIGGCALFIVGTAMMAVHRARRRR